MHLTTVQSPFIIWTILLALSAFAFWFETTRIGKHISGPAILIVLAFLLSELKIIPKSSSVYETIWDYFLPIAIPLLLFQANLKTIVSESGRLLVIFLFGALGTFLGAILAYKFFDLGAYSAEFTGIFTATYIGGSMNFAAVSQALGIQDSNMLSAALAADNIAGTVYLLMLAVLPSISGFARLFTASNSQAHNINIQPEKTEVDPDNKEAPFTVLYLTTALALSVGICAFADLVSTMVGLTSITMLLITSFTVLLATAAPKSMKKLAGGDRHIGMLIMYLFMVSVGAGADVNQLINLAPVFLLFAGTIISVHFLIITFAGKALKYRFEEVLTASNACVLGPPAAAALAAARGWDHLITPAILIGTLGYTIANFLGVIVSKILQ